jgi:hypothetical protein
MATNSADVLNAAEPVQRSFTRFADRWIFVFTQKDLSHVDLHD